MMEIRNPKETTDKLTLELAFKVAVEPPELRTRLQQQKMQLERSIGYVSFNISTMTAQKMPLLPEAGDQQY